MVFYPEPPGSSPLSHDDVVRLLEARFHGPLPTAPFRGVRSDHRDRGGDLFVAIRGAHFDSHRFLDGSAEGDEALRGIRGAVGEVAPPPPRRPYYQVQSSRRALALLEHRFCGNPEQRLRVVGVTGTNGKSTTVRLLASILESSGRRTGWMGTVSQRLGAEEVVSGLTTPEPRQLAREMTRWANCRGDDLVLEVSSHALHQSRVAGIEFAGAVLTSFSRDHFDYHGSRSAYRAAKLSLFAQVAEGGPAVLPRSFRLGADAIADGSTTAETLRRVSIRRFALTSPADAFVTRRVLTREGIEAELEVLGDRFSVHSPLVGRHNLTNILAAALLARALGVSPHAIAEGIAGMPPVRGRLQPVLAGERTIFVDFAHTPDALRVMLRAVREVAPGHLGVVFGCGGDRDRGKRPQMGRIAERLSDRVYLTSDNPRGENPGEVLAQIHRGMRGRAPVVIEVDRRAAIHRAIRELHAGDVLVVAGKGHERTQEIGEKRVPFDDVEVIREALAAAPARVTVGKTPPKA